MQASKGFLSSLVSSPAIDFSTMFSMALRLHTEALRSPNNSDSAGNRQKCPASMEELHDI
jgi:hypothetical protein